MTVPTWYKKLFYPAYDLNLIDHCASVNNAQISNKRLNIAFLWFEIFSHFRSRQTPYQLRATRARSERRKTISTQAVEI